MSPAPNPVPRPCPLCEGAARGPAFPYASRFADRDYRYLACAACGTRYIDPLPDAGAFAAMYAPGDYHAVFYDGVGQGAYGATARLLTRHLRAGARVFDYGCGAGHLLAALRDAGFAASGGEFSAASAANAATRSGCPVVDLSSSGWRDTGPWDCIHFGDVIEHLPGPRTALVDALAALAPGGLLSAEGPLEANLSPVNQAARLFGWLKHLRAPDAAGEFPPYHLIFTTAAAQRAFFGRLGEPLHEEHWEVFENGWPYRHNGTVRNAIALVAVAASKVVPGSGNRFRALFRKGR
jgi:SAM-dependent methyltransferase